jgi:hypothetical protein
MIKNNLKSSNYIEKRQMIITARLAAQGAMLEELKALVSVIQPESARNDVRQAIIEDNIFHRPSINSRAKVFGKLGVRYFRYDMPIAVERFVRALKNEPDQTQIALLAYTMLLWNDALVFTLGEQWLARRLSGPRFPAETSEIEAELDRLSKQVPEIKKWTLNTRRKVSTKYLGLLRDCSFATGTLKKVLRRPYISPDVILFSVQLIIGGGDSLVNLPGHSLFKAMGLSIDDVIEKLTELQAQSRIDFAVQGGIVYFAPR